MVKGESRVRCSKVKLKAKVIERENLENLAKIEDLENQRNPFLQNETIWIRNRIIGVENYGIKSLNRKD